MSLKYYEVSFLTKDRKERKLVEVEAVGEQEAIRKARLDLTIDDYHRFTIADATYAYNHHATKLNQLVDTDL